MSTATIFNSVTCEELNSLANAGEIDLIDVRTPVEFREIHSVHARNVPLDSLDPQAVMSTRGRASDRPLYVICRSGNRSGKACEAFVAAGFSNVINVSGGTTAWNEAGLPVNRGKKAVSLERQVRIAAGVLVSVGTILGAFVHEYWLGLPAFVGVGLMFAGITDTCAMGMLIAKMPWNQVGDASPENAADSKPGGASGDASAGSCCDS